MGNSEAPRGLRDLRKPWDQFSICKWLYGPIPLADKGQRHKREKIPSEFKWGEELMPLGVFL